MILEFIHICVLPVLGRHTLSIVYFETNFNGLSVAGMATILIDTMKYSNHEGALLHFIGHNR